MEPLIITNKLQVQQPVSINYVYNKTNVLYAAIGLNMDMQKNMHSSFSFLELNWHLKPPLFQSHGRITSLTASFYPPQLSYELCCSYYTDLCI